MMIRKKVFILLVLCLFFSWPLAEPVLAKGNVTELELTLDKTKMPQPTKGGGPTSKRPPENLRDLINLKKIPILDVAALAKNGGKELAAEIKAYMASGYNFYVVELGMNLGPSQDYKFIEANLAYQFPPGDSGVKVFDIFPQTTYEEILKISGKVGLDVSLGYRVPVPQIPANATITANFLIEPRPWVWRVATIESTGKYTSRAGWIFKIDEKSADLQTRMVLMSKIKPPFSVAVKGWVKIHQGTLHRNYYYNIDSADVELSE